MKANEIIDGILKREGGFVDHPADRGGPTRFGVTAGTLGDWRNLGRHATAAEVYDMTEAEARDIYEARYVAPFDSIQDEALRVQLVDFAVTSGPRAAVKTLQQMLGVEADGILGPLTLAACAAFPPEHVNNLLVVGRVSRMVADVEANPRQRVFVWGWLRRFVQFKV